MLQYVADNADQFKTQYGNISAASAGAIQRNLLALESQGADKFFGEPALNLEDLIQTKDGKGTVNILAADKLMQKSPKVYATFFLWMLSELFENLPEIGDPEKPKLVFFFDEAHLLFADIAPAVEQKIEQMVRLIRSKGVGVYFVSQNPLDIPDVVLGQLGNRVQHALRAFTPRDQKAVKAAAETFRQNPNLKVETVLTQLAVGEALVSMLDENGSPQIVERAKIVPPRSQIGAITAGSTKTDHQFLDHRRPLREGYRSGIGLRNTPGSSRAKGQTAEAPNVPAPPQPAKKRNLRYLAKPWQRSQRPFNRQLGRAADARDSLATSMVKSAMRAASSQLGRPIVRGILGGILGGSGSRTAGAIVQAPGPAQIHLHAHKRHRYTKKSPDTFCAPGDLNCSCLFLLGAPAGLVDLLSFPLCLPSLPLLWLTSCR